MKILKHDIVPFIGGEMKERKVKRFWKTAKRAFDLKVPSRSVCGAFTQLQALYYSIKALKGSTRTVKNRVGLKHFQFKGTREPGQPE